MSESAANDSLHGPVLALDFGRARTGVAISDPTRTIARPCEPILRANTSDGLATIAHLATTRQVSRIIVGLPTGLGGHPTKQTEQCRSFAARLARSVEVPVELYDERFTSLLADRTRVETGSDSSRDSLAASHLLTSWMEAHER